MKIGVDWVFLPLVLLCKRLTECALASKIYFGKHRKTQRERSMTVRWGWGGIQSMSTYFDLTSPDSYQLKIRISDAYLPQVSLFLSSGVLQRDPPPRMHFSRDLWRHERLYRVEEADWQPTKANWLAETIEFLNFRMLSIYNYGF